VAVGISTVKAVDRHALAPDSIARGEHSIPVRTTKTTERFSCGARHAGLTFTIERHRTVNVIAMSTERPRRTRGARGRAGIPGYAPTTASGKPRTNLAATRLDDDEQTLLHRLLESRGFPVNSTGLREFLLAEATKTQPEDAQAA